MPQAATRPAADFVDGASHCAPSTRPSVPACAWSASAPRERRARRLAVDLDLEGAHRRREGDAAARPVRRAGRAGAGAAGALLAPRLRAAAGDEPAALRTAGAGAAAFSSARTTSWTRWGFTSAPNTLPSSVTSFADFARSVPRSRGLDGLSARAGWRLCAFSSLISTMPFFGTGDGALDEQQVLLRVDLVDEQADLGDALAAQAAGHLHALEDARRRRRRADRARLADVVRAVRLRAAVELVPLDRAGEALADPDARRP